MFNENSKQHVIVFVRWFVCSAVTTLHHKMSSPLRMSPLEFMRRKIMHSLRLTNATLRSIALLKQDVQWFANSQLLLPSWNLYIVIQVGLLYINPQNNNNKNNFTLQRASSFRERTTAYFFRHCLSVKSSFIHCRI